ncbi:MAG: hypothetical protein Q4G68_13015 [Planctomycetia bacterium]|nr:hypothetical protein [Planctomycetia bacterium]
MKINRPFILFSIFLVFFAGPALLFATGRPVDEPDAEPVDDGLPLLITRETDQLLAAFLALRAQQEELPARSLGSVGFISLNRQSHAFRGKIIELNGRLLQTRQLLADFNGQNGFNSLYESWMLLDDEKRIPVRLLSTSVPQEILASLPNNSGANPADNAGKFEITQKGEYGPLRIHAYASYYRLTSYSDGQDFYNAPTALALSFSLSPTASQPGDSSPNINDTKAINQIKQKSQIEQVEQTSQNQPRPNRPRPTWLLTNCGGYCCIVFESKVHSRFSRRTAT